MADLKMTLSTTVQTIVDNNEETIYSYVNNNPGETQDEIVTGTSLAVNIVSNLLRIQAQNGLLRAASDLSGNVKYYTAADWASELSGNLASARTYIASNDGALVSDMATALTVSDEVAIALARMMSNEKRVSVIGVSGE